MRMKVNEVGGSTPLQKRRCEYALQDLRFPRLPHTSREFFCIQITKNQANMKMQCAAAFML